MLMASGGKILQGNIQVSRLRSIMSEIIRNIYVIYIQSTLKYATLIDQAIESGQGFEKAQVKLTPPVHSLHSYSILF